MCRSGLATLVMISVIFASSSAVPQQTPKAATQSASQNARSDRQSLQAQARQLLSKESARETAGDCPTAQTTVDFDTCFDRQLKLTEANLQQFEGIIRQLQTSDGSGSDADSAASKSLAELEQMDRKWESYRDAACTAAFHQFEGGSGAPSFEMQCQLELTRDRMRELHLIYGEDLDL